MSARGWDLVCYTLEAVADRVERVTSAPIRRLERRAYARWKAALGRER